jgi:very-short-patch-repair endonuclease
MTRPVIRSARKLRADMPPAERILWSRLRRGALGHRFRRQHPIGPYVADFCCVAARVVDEVDGGSHYDSIAARAYDAERDRFISSSGWVILRFTNAQMRGELNAVCHAITAACDDGMRGTAPSA